MHPIQFHSFNSGKTFYLTIKDQWLVNMGRVPFTKLDYDCIDSDYSDF